MRISCNDRMSLRPVTLAVLAAFSTATPLLASAANNPAAGSALDASDFVVNTHTANNQWNPAAARDAAGDFVVVWQSYDQAGATSKDDIYAQRYHTDGSKNGTEFLVNTITSDFQSFPTVGMDAAGDFVVAWVGANEAVTSSGQVYFQRFNASGAPMGSETLVNSSVFTNEVEPRAAMDATGDFVLVWEDKLGNDGNNYGIFARRYQSDGTPIDGSEFPVNTQTSGNQYAVTVAMDAVGDFVAVWSDIDNDAIKGRRFTLTGDTTSSTEFQINTNTYTNSYPYIGMDARGDFVVGWVGYYTSSGASVETFNNYVRRYDKQDNALDPSDVLVYSDATTFAAIDGVAMDAEGDYVVEITNYDGLDGSGDGIFGELFRADGTLVPPAVPVAGHASMFQVNTTTSGDQRFLLDVAMDADGDLVMAWTDWGFNDGSGYGVYARRFAGPQLTDLATTLTGPSNTADGGGSFNLTASVNNANASTGNSTINSYAALASGIELSIALPSGATFNSATGTDWTCGTVSFGTLTCSYSGTLGLATSSDSLKLNFTAPSSSTTLNFKSTVSTTEQTDTDSSNDSATASVSVTASSSGGGGGAPGLLSLLFVGLLSFTRRRRTC